MRYTKMHGAGNSVVILENLRGELEGEDLRVLALRLCSRETGSGADGMIVVAPASAGDDFDMLFYNADGSLGEMCGNGARCLARYGVEHGLVRDPEAIRFRATAGRITGRRISREQYQVRLNDPSVVDLHRPASVDGETVDCAYVELGDPGIPHAVVLASPADFEELDALRLRGRALRFNPAFLKGANVTFACVTGPDSVRAVTYERGVEDFTLACGTGCGATALSLLLSGRLSGQPVEIRMPGGLLRVSLTLADGQARDILLTGPTALVEEGEFSLPE